MVSLHPLSKVGNVPASHVIGRASIATASFEVEASPVAPPLPLASALTLASLAPAAPLDVPPMPAPADPPAPTVAAPPVPEGSAPPPVVEPFVVAPVAVALVVAALVPVAAVAAPPAPLEPLGSSTGPMSALPQASRTPQRSAEEFPTMP